MAALPTRRPAPASPSTGRDGGGPLRLGLSVSLGLVLLSSAAGLVLCLRYVGLSRATLPALAGWSLILCLVGVIAVRLAPSPGRALAAALAAGLLARILAFAFVLEGRPIGGDPTIYTGMARHFISSGELVHFDEHHRQYQWAFFPPAYPVLIGLFQLVFGFNSCSIFILHLAIDAFIIASIFHLGVRLQGPEAAALASTVYALWPTLIWLAGFPQKETLSIALVCLNAASLLAPSRPARLGWRRAMAFGGSWGALALTQPALALFPPLLGLVLLRRQPLRATVAFGLRAGVILLLVMGPWWARNHAVLDRFVPLTTSAGWALWVGNNPGATGEWMPPPPDLVGLPEAEMSDRAASKALRWIAENPSEFLVRTARKVILGLGSDRHSFGAIRDFRDIPGEWIFATLATPLQMYHLAVVLLAFCAVMDGRRVPAELCVISFLSVLYIVLVEGWFEFSERHTYFARPFLALLAASFLAGRFGRSAHPV
ncbi:ArnT family glycosyltransferase [Caldovatus sediminis]|uniref:ArnT family glycosyltransferase n=1 Tax=Caldovatus sediminis TaxID=2041189 RepID=UPI0016695833|nr:glycosyltransferase family 39 protein [Caldovatus sediminis]